VWTWTGTGPLGEGWDAVWNSTPDRFSDDWDASNIPPVYLTEWGFLSVVFYFCCALMQSILGYKARKQPANGASGSSNIPTSFSAKSSYPFTPLSIIAGHDRSPPSVFDHVTAYSFALAATIQPFIVLGFWGLVFPFSHQCNYRCATVHGGCFVLIYLDLLVNKITVDKSLLKLVILYPLVWLLTQIWWIYTDHHPDYQILPMDNLLSLGLSIGCLCTFLVSFYVARWFCDKRDVKYGFPGGVSGREGPPASAYFNNGGEASIRF
jgi:hypothetical protein